MQTLPKSNKGRNYLSIETFRKNYMARTPKYVIYSICSNGQRKLKHSLPDSKFTTFKNIPVKNVQEYTRNIYSIAGKAAINAMRSLT